MIDPKDEIANLIIDSNIDDKRKLELIKYQNDHHEGVNVKLDQVDSKLKEIQRDRSHLSGVLAQILYDKNGGFSDVCENPSIIISDHAIAATKSMAEKGKSPLFDYVENEHKSATLSLTWQGSDKKSDEVSSGDSVGESEDDDKSTDG